MKEHLPLIVLAMLFYIGCTKSKESVDDRISWDSLEVTATAYNSTEFQTKKDNPSLAAWGDTLVPGMKAIAVSRDLIKLGLTHNSKVRIKGLDGIYLVKDKMNKRWKRKIDIYMGLDVKKAKKWGKRQVTLFYSLEEPREED